MPSQSIVFEKMTKGVEHLRLLVVVQNILLNVFFFFFNPDKKPL